MVEFNGEEEGEEGEEIGLRFEGDRRNAVEKDVRDVRGLILIALCGVSKGLSTDIYSNM